MKADILASAMRLLALREHSSSELRRKLGQKGYSVDAIDAIIKELTRDGLLSDERFIEAFIRSRSERGQGPQRIQQDLQAHELSAELIASYLDPRERRWLVAAQQVREKKFGKPLPADYKERMRQARFLEYRGFTHEQIRRIMRDEELIAN